MGWTLAASERRARTHRFKAHLLALLFSALTRANGPTYIRQPGDEPGFPLRGVVSLFIIAAVDVAAAIAETVALAAEREGAADAGGDGRLIRWFLAFARVQGVGVQDAVTVGCGAVELGGEEGAACDVVGCAFRAWGRAGRWVEGLGGAAGGEVGG